MSMYEEPLHGVLEAELLLENAELAASHARLREVLKAIEANGGSWSAGYAKKALSETPASLAAITAPLEARITELEAELERHLTDRVNQRLEVAKIRELLGESLKAVMWVSGPSHPRALEISQLLAKPAAASLEAIQAAARSEERKACEAAIEDKADGRSTIPVSEALWAVRNRATEEQP